MLLSPDSATARMHTDQCLLSHGISDAAMRESCNSWLNFPMHVLTGRAYEMCLGNLRNRPLASVSCPEMPKPYTCCTFNPEVLYNVQFFLRMKWLKCMKHTLCRILWVCCRRPSCYSTSTLGPNQIRPRGQGLQSIKTTSSPFMARFSQAQLSNIALRMVPSKGTVEGIEPSP